MNERDERKEAVKAAFARDPLPLVRALGLDVDDRRSGKRPGELWVYDGAEDDASLQIGGKPGREGQCTRYGDDWTGDCFALVQRYRPQMSFRERLEFVAEVYGVELAERRPRRKAGAEAKVVAEKSYPVQVDGEVIAVHRRQDLADGSKRIWWAGPDGKGGLPESVELADLPLWGHEQLAEHPKRAVIVCEGEKDADALIERGALALGTYGAGVVPSLHSLAMLAHRKVFLWPDNDAAGARHMGAIAERLAALGAQARVIEWTDCDTSAGAADWFASGRTREELKALLQAARPWREVPGTKDEQGSMYLLVETK